MAHLVSSVRGAAIDDVLTSLNVAHGFLARRAHAALARVPAADPGWGVHMKRLAVDLDGERPPLVGKSRESFAEVVNMLATLERLLAALRWFSRAPAFAGLRVGVCHPSTSSVAGENDLVLVDAAGTVRARCEVCDVVSSKAGQNGKEQTDLTNLGCARGVPADGVARFVCTSPEFAGALMSVTRHWVGVMHRYRAHRTGDGTGTVLLELLTANAASG